MGRRGATAIAGLALLAAACGGGEGDASRDPGGSASPSPSASSSSPSATASPEPTPAVRPATGVQLEVNGFRVNALDKWRINNSVVFAESAYGPLGDGRSGGIAFGVAPAAQMSLAQTMRRSWQPGTKPSGFEEQPGTVLGGLSAFYYTAEAGKFLTEHVMGNWDGGYVIELNIQVPNDYSPERQQEIVDSIVATYRSPRQG